MKSTNGTHSYRVMSTKHGMELNIETELKETKFDVMQRLMWGIVHYYIDHGRAKDMWHSLSLMLSCAEDNLTNAQRNSPKEIADG